MYCRNGNEAGLEWEPGWVGMKIRLGNGRNDAGLEWKWG